MSQRALELEAGGSRVVVHPDIGGKIGELVLGGRDWLWKSEILPYREPEPSARDDYASYVETADSGGYDECFPTVAACTLPPELPAFGGLRLPDHGELWSQRAEVHAVGDQIVARWRGRRMPYEFERAISVRDDGSVAMEYAATNEGHARMPFLWSAHPLVPLGLDTRVELPEGSRVRVWAQHSVDLGGPLAEHRWPMIRVDGQLVDLSRPASLERPFACKLFFDLEGAEPVAAAVLDAGARLEVAMHPAQVPNFGLWINFGGWTPFAGGDPYFNMAFEPCIGAPDSLTAALGEWESAAWLAPGEMRRWSLRWRGDGANA
jgi:galactose mutarotase-like enzyme